MKRWIAVILIAPILGAVIGYLLVYALDNSWFHSKWKRIEAPPGEGFHLVAVSGDSLWVQSGTGKIYHNEHAAACQSNCWQEVPEIQNIPVLEEPGEATVTSEACAPSLPLLGVTERISECRRTLWVDHSTTFALRKNGSLFLWQAELFKEWSVVLFFLGVCGGALALLIPALVIVLVLGLLNRRSRFSARI